MVLEIAEFRIRPGEQAAFEEAMERALRTITATAKGVTDYKLFRSVESPERYVMQVAWDSVEDHLITYGQSPEHEQWRAIVRPFYAQAARYEHFIPLLTA